jgi:hypothetical protein
MYRDSFPNKFPLTTLTTTQTTWGANNNEYFDLGVDDPSMQVEYAFVW